MRLPGLASVVLAAGLSAAGVDPSALPDGVLEAVQTDSVTVLCVADSGGFFTLDVPTGETAAWVPSWTPGDDGWAVLGPPRDLMVSPDGRFVAFIQSVLIPDGIKFPPGFYGSRDPDLLQAARPDGSEARPVAVGVSVGSGPRAWFDPGTSVLVLEGFSQCIPTPDGYAMYMLGRVAPLLFDAFDPDTGTLVPTDAMEPEKTD